jgi:MYXO-CTERM domain-containing protein
LKRAFAFVVASSSVLFPRAAGAVIGGAPDGQSHFSVGVALGNETDRTPHCSGTLISPYAVLTARHCVSTIPRDHVDCAADEFSTPSVATESLWVTTNADLRPANAGWHRVRASFVPHTGRVCGDDLALLELVDAVADAEATPLEVVTSPATFHRETDARQFRAIGFGESDLNGTGAGVRRALGGVTIECVRGDTRFFCGDYLANSVEGEMIGTGGPCAGDSGMAALSTGATPLVLGVLARSTLNPQRCEDGVYERTDRWAWFIGETLLELARMRAIDAPGWAVSLFPRAGEHASAGAYCRTDSECADSKCLSGDEGRSFVCAPACSAAGACIEGFLCQGGSCFPSTVTPPPPAEAGCKCTSGASGTSDGVELLAALGMVVALERRRRSKR